MIVPYVNIYGQSFIMECGLNAKDQTPRSTKYECGNEICRLCTAQHMPDRAIICMTRVGDLQHVRPGNLERVLLVIPLLPHHDEQQSDAASGYTTYANYDGHLSSAVRHSIVNDSMMCTLLHQHMMDASPLTSLSYSTSFNPSWMPSP